MFHRIGPAAYKANLDNTIALSDALGNPEKNLVCIHVAGTNGKGSVSHMLASIFMEAGYKTGLYTSPHLVDFRERIRINGEMAGKEWIAEFVTKNQNLFQDIQPSFFEMSTVMAFCYFKEHQTEIAIIETGLGGRLDSTNIITPELSIITNIGWDHMNLLGDTLEKIAIEKAGIIKNNITVVIGETQVETKDVFIEKSNHCNNNIYFSDQHFTAEYEFYHPLADLQKLNIYKEGENYIDQLECDLTGTYQKKNIKTVIQSYDLLKDKFHLLDNHLRAGLKNVKLNTGLKGRWQKLGEHPTIICDTAHNVNGLQEIIPVLNLISHQQLHIVLGMVNDKEIDKVLQLLPKDAIYYFCKANIPRGLDANILRENANQYSLNGNAYASVNDAFKSAKNNATKDDLIFIGGSTFTVAEVVGSN